MPPQELTVRATVKRSAAHGEDTIALELTPGRAAATPTKRIRSAIFPRPAAAASAALSRQPAAGGSPAGHTAYLRLGEFTASSAREMRDELAELRARGADRLVLDLRGNGGGAFSGALGVAGLFMEDQPAGVAGDEGAAGRVVVWTEDTRGDRTVHISRERQAWAGPMEVWTDWQTASASELVVGALQDDCRAAVVALGPTYGKGVAQRVFGLSDGSALVQTVLRRARPLHLSTPRPARRLLPSNPTPHHSHPAIAFASRPRLHPAPSAIPFHHTTGGPRDHTQRP